MPRNPPQLAKLTRPRVHKAVARERLFALLDNARNHNTATCVVGPPGAGKTTLVASWLDARNIRGIWYQVDPGDADLASCFYYLGQAAKTFGRKGHRPLPLLTPEHLQNLAGFSRRFFRELYSRLPAGAALVLDNYQEVARNEPFHQMIIQAIDEAPEGTTVIVISRSDPPDCYARLIANEHVAFVDWAALKLTLEEARSIAAARTWVRDDDLAYLHVRSDGWAAGLTLLLEQGRRTGFELDLRDSTIDSVFDYFATQIFDRLPQRTQKFLVDTAFLPRVTVPIAQELTGHMGSAEILENLYRRHLFTHRRPGDVLSYQYHTLFQTFLRMQARKLLSGEEEKTLASRVAHLLEANGLVDDAVMLYREASDWDSVGRLIHRTAPALLAQGRGQTLREWAGALPEQRVQSDPWLLYWIGTSMIPVNQKAARQHLEQAFERFATADEIQGQALAASGIIDAYYYEWSEFGPMTTWLRPLERVVSNALVFESQEIELQIHSSLIIATMYAQPDHPLLAISVARVTEMLDLDIDVNLRIRAATFLLSFCSITNSLERGRNVVAKVEPLLGRPELSPLNQIWWRTRRGYLAWNLTEYESAKGLLDEAERIAEEHGLAGLRSAKILWLNYRLFNAVALGDFKTGEACLRSIDMLPDLDRRMGDWHRTIGRIEYELGRGNTRPAFERGTEAVKAARESGMIYIQIVALLAEARGLADFGTHEEVRQVLERADSLAKGTCFAHLHSEVLLIAAYSILRHEGRARGTQLLADALRHARQAGYTYNVRWNATMPYLCAEALELHIEVDYVMHVIGKYRLRPPSGDIEDWPWPVKIYTLGRFEVWRDGILVTFAGKVPKKPLMLLKVLTAFGGHAVPEHKLCDALWSDEDADMALKSLDVNVVRLRRLLGHQSAIVAGDALVGLNPNICWVDAWAFERKAQSIEPWMEGATVERYAEQAFSLYRGEFLPAETDADWALGRRELLRGRFLRLVESVAMRYERAQLWEQALARYQGGLQADQLAESFYQGSMRCLGKMGRHSEAIGAYRRLRQLLSVLLGVSPSEASQSLARELQRDNPAQHRPP